MTIAQEEIFGPVLTAIRFTDEAEALSIANDTQYGLTAYVWTNDVTRAMRFTNQLEAGMIWVNSENVRHLPTPSAASKHPGSAVTAATGALSFTWNRNTSALPPGTTKSPVLAPEPFRFSQISRGARGAEPLACRPNIRPVHSEETRHAHSRTDPLPALQHHPPQPC